MDMNRRNVLLGLGTAAAGSGIVFGSGAFTQVEAERDISIEVDNDSGDVLLGLDANGDVDSVFENADGALEVDIGNALDGSTGINVDSELQIGRVDDTETLNNETEVTTEAFTITDDSDPAGDEFEEVDLNVELEVTTADTNQEVNVVIEDDPATNDTVVLTADGDDTPNSEDEDFAPLDFEGDDAEVAFVIDTGTEGSDPENIDANLTFTVNTEDSE